MQDPRLGSGLRILPPASGQFDGLALTAGHMGNPPLVQHGVGLFSQPAQFRRRIVETVPDDGGIGGGMDGLRSKPAAKHPAKFRRAHRQRCVIEEDDLRAIGAAEMLGRITELFVVFRIPCHGRKTAVGQQILEVVPFLEREDHIRPDNQRQPRIGVTFLQLPYRVIGVALPVSLQLQRRDLNMFQVTEGQAAQFQALFRCRAPLFHFLMRWLMIRYDQQQIRTQRIQRRDHRLAVAQMRRIEAPAVDGDVHRNSVL